MIGPFPPGYTETTLRKKRGWEHLEPGNRYKVMREFKDNDGQLHPAGETWVFLGSNYHPLDEGLSLFVATDDGNEWHIPMQGGADQQGAMLDSLGEYIELTGLSGRQLSVAATD